MVLFWKGEFYGNLQAIRIKLKHKSNRRYGQNIHPKWWANFIKAPLTKSVKNLLWWYLLNESNLILNWTNLDNVIITEFSLQSSYSQNEAVLFYSSVWQWIPAMYLILHNVCCVHHLRLWLQRAQRPQSTSKTPQQKCVSSIQWMNKECSRISQFFWRVDLTLGK